jgi:SAM-dependent methyltransferase
LSSLLKYSSKSVPQIFNRRHLRYHRDRASSYFDDFLIKEIADRLVERLNVVKRSFAVGIDLGCHTGQMADALEKSLQRPAFLVECDLSYLMLSKSQQAAVNVDEEFLPFAANSLDVVISCLSLHWVNDLPGTLAQIHSCLKPDGLFLAALFGGETLKELRECLAESELALIGGIHPRISPFINVRDAGYLLQRAGFSLPVADYEKIMISYPSPMALLRDIKSMGQTNILYDRQATLTGKALFAGMADLYQQKYGDSFGRIPATVDVIYLSGWKPHPSQPKALRPGSAQHRLAQALDTQEHSAGEKVKN